MFFHITQFYIIFTKVKKKKKKLKIDTSMSNRDEKILHKAIGRMTDMYKRKSNQLVKRAIELGKDHIVMENLESMAKGYTRSKEFNNIKYSKLIRLLHLADLKNIVTSIANKNGLQVTFVQAHYTSQTCKCGYISRNNRKTQEKFCCVECGYEMDADINSALNIENRMSNKELRTKLLNEKDGTFTPKIMNKISIKNIIYNTTTLSG